MKAVLVIVLLSSATCLAQSDANSVNFTESGNNFVGFCSVADNDVKDLNPLEGSILMVCAGYVVGVVDGVVVKSDFVRLKTSKRPPTLLCLPDNKAQRVQSVRVVLKYVRNHPEKAHLPAGSLVVTALREAYPCSQ